MQTCTGLWGVQRWGSDSGGAGGPISHNDLTMVTANQHHAEDHAARHALGGPDALDVTDLAGYPGGTTDFLRADGSFATPPGGGTGDVVGPASSTDGGVVLFDGTTGKLLKEAPRFKHIDDALCVRLSNFSGGLISKGTPVIADGAVDLACLIATNATEEEIIGVCMEDSTDPGGGVDIWIAVSGIFPVNVTAPAIVRGNFLMMSGAAGLASDTASGAPGVFAIALQAKPGATPGQSVLAMFIKSETF